MSDQLRVLYWLVARNCVVLKKELSFLLFDSFFSVALHLLLFIYIFPLFGVPFEFIPSIFLGTGVIWFLFMQGDAYCLNLASDIEGVRVIDYQLTLPICKELLLFSYTVTYIIKTAIVTVPSIIIGMYCLSWYASNIVLSWVPFFFYYCIAMAFCALLFLSLAFRYSFDWLLVNLWPRRIGPMISLGAIAVPWYYMAKKIPFISYIALCSPATYIAEGLRVTMLEGSFLSVYTCVCALLAFSVVSYKILLSGIKNKLDSV